jgi:site-specific DNA-methyltransferase (adenine-specific)
MSTNHKIYVADARDMKKVPDKSVQLIITSPPYWQLKDYGSNQQIGFYDSYEDYINNLNLVWEECNRVLSPGCKLCINIGDQFARSIYYGRYKVIPIRDEIVRYCETMGLDYMGAIIWQKVTTCNTSGGATIMGSFPYPRNGILKLDYEYILIFKKQGVVSTPSKSMKEKSKLSIEEWNKYFSGHWNFAGEKQNQHLAMFPEELPKRLIKMFSFINETILDPFLGSGTTSLAAYKLERNSIGFEINEEFLPIIKNKLQSDNGLKFDEFKFEVINRPNNFNYNKLRYLFNDPVKINKLIDPRKLTFGSVINKNNNNKEELLVIKKINNFNEVVTETGLKLKLIGIVRDDVMNDKAIAFLKENIENKQIIIKFDEKKYDDNGDLLCYIYLNNRMFVNAHLIKRRLVKPDLKSIYKYKDIFIKYYNNEERL